MPPVRAQEQHPTDELPPWAQPASDVLSQLGSQPAGLDEAQAQVRWRSQRAKGPRKASALRLFVAQIKSPLVLMLLAAALLSVVVRETTDAAVILGIVLLSTVLGFTQEHGATRAVEKLLSLVITKSRVLRGGQEAQVPTDQVVPGDIVLFSAGSIVPGDCRILQARDLHADEAALTGETFPVEKEAAAVAASAPLAARRSMLFAGTHVVSGTAQAVVVRTGDATELGQIASRLDRAPPPSDFERGVERFGLMIAQVTSVLALVILAANLALQRPWLESFLFSLALAVGLVPELLPAIVSVNLSRGARRMAAAQVIVKRLSSIEDFGAIDVLCTDKTGTLTEGRVQLDRAVGASGQPSATVLRAAVLNARFESGLENPIDEALRRAQDRCPPGDERKLDEVPYDFVRKRLSVLVADGAQLVLITKGAVAQVLDICTQALDDQGHLRPLAELRPTIDATFSALSQAGLRCLGVAHKILEGDPAAPPTVRAADEAAMVFLGFVAFLDPPKAGVRETIAELRSLGVGLKMITGDNAAVAATVAQRVGIESPTVLTGRELRETSDEALARRAQSVDVFAEIDPNQKERIILSLRRAGHVVGYLGDGINDAPALHAAHVGISVDTAVDVAKEAAQIVLLQNNLSVLIEGVRQGRATLENTLKYIHITASANFGNMLSMALAGMFLPFLPLLPKQILLNNLLSDLPAMTVGGDRVDAAQLATARRWDAREIRRFMMIFGTISSLFDIATFSLLRLLQTSAALFQSSWFVESLLTEVVILLVMRTRGPLWRSQPSLPLLLSVLGVSAAAIALPYLPGAGALGLVPIPASLLGLLLAITLAYALVSEVFKRRFFAAHAATAT